MQLLDPSALLETIQRLVPAAGECKLKNRHDALAALVHATLTRLSFRLTSLSDEPSDTHVRTYADNVLPVEWSASGPSSYTFRYAHEQSSLTFFVKVVSLGARVLVHATALESNRTESYEVELERFTSRSFWPWPSKDTTEPLVNGYVSSSRIADFVFGFQVKIVQKLVPGLRKDGYEEVSENEQDSSSASASNGSSSTPQSSRPARPAPPILPEDPDDIYPRPPVRDPLIVGDRDLDPFGGGRAGGFGPPPLFGGPGGRFPGGDNGGGMIVGPDHPMFRDRFQRPGQGGGGGIGGGIVPPGARFDPVTPFGGVGPLGPAGRGPPRRPPGMGDPDWDEMPPPGNNGDYDNMFM